MISYSIRTETGVYDSKDILQIDLIVKQCKRENKNFAIFREKNGKVKPLAYASFNVYCSNARTGKDESYVPSKEEPIVLDIENSLKVHSFGTDAITPEEEPISFAVSVASDALCNKMRGIGHLDRVECYRSGNEIKLRTVVDTQEQIEVLPLEYNIEQLELIINKFTGVYHGE